METSEYTYQRGLPEHYRSSAASLYFQAFGQKFSVAVRSDQKLITLLESCIDPKYAIVAIDDAKLAGIAGFHTSKGSLTGNISYNDLVTQLGALKGTWAALIFSLYERKPTPGELLMDGISVHRDYRSKGIGSKLLNEITKYANENNYKKIRLDVIDINPRARKLYIKKDFRAVKTENFSYLKWLLGFSSSTTMEKVVE